MGNFKKVSQIISISILVLLIVSGIYLAIAKSANFWPFNNRWQAVSLVTGETYFGHLVWFPSPHLIDVWYIRNINQKGKISARLFPLSSVSWQPENVLYLKSRNIAWWTTLRKNSQIVQQIKRAESQISQGISQRNFQQATPQSPTKSPTPATSKKIKK